MHEVIVIAVAAGKRCAPCEALKEWLDDKGVSYKTMSVQEAINEGWNVSLITALPATIIDGRVLIGLQFKKIKKILGLP